MHLYRLIALEAILLLLSGCYTTDERNMTQKKVDADYRCEAMGYMLPDSAEYDKCVAYERAYSKGAPSNTMFFVYSDLVPPANSPAPCNADCISKQEDYAPSPDSGDSPHAGHSGGHGK